MDEYFTKYIDSQAQLAGLNARLAFLRDILDEEGYLTPSKVYAIFGWDKPEEKEAD